MVGFNGDTGNKIAELVTLDIDLQIRTLYKPVACNALSEQLGKISGSHQPGFIPQFPVLIEMDRNQPVIFGRRDNGGCLQHIAVLIEIRRRDSDHLLRLVEERGILVRQGIRPVCREHQQGHLDNTRERQLEVTGPVPQPGMVEYLLPTDRQITVVSEHVEILVSVLVGIDKLDTQVSGLDHLVMEGQVDIARNAKPVPVQLLEIGNRAEIPVLLHDITVRYPDVRNLAGLYDLHVAVLARY